MHEVSLVIGLVGQLENIAAAHGATRVRRFVLEVGAMSNVVPELLRDAVQVVSADVPLLREADCVIEEIELTLRCHDCGAVTHPESFTFGCPKCGSAAVTAEKGEELMLRQVELELPDEPAPDDEANPPEPN